MAIQDELREQLIKQLPAEVTERVDAVGALYYACPTCHRPVALEQKKCICCNQTLSWENVRTDRERNGVKRGHVEFDLPLDFTIGNCRKCPLSYIARSGDDNVYECPLGSRGACKIQVL